MSDTDDWADRKARLIAPLQLWRLPTAIASALRDARREGIEAAIEHVEEHWFRDSRLLVRGLRALAAGGKGE